MLAEIILLRLEIALRLAEQVRPATVSRFVPLVRGIKPHFKRKLAVV
jgi:hypothetical protein